MPVDDGSIKVSIQVSIESAHLGSTHPLLLSGKHLIRKTMATRSIAPQKHFRGSVGVETRGKTTMNRLRRVDNFVLMYCRELIMSDQHIYVDLGYGYTPITTFESARRFRRYNADLGIVGIEIDTQRVRAAQDFVDHQTDFRHGGFNLPLQTNRRTDQKETVNLIRAFNVLRQYEHEADCRNAHLIMGQYLNLHGILIEGTSDPLGRVWVANIVRKQRDHSLQIEALVFSTNFREGFDIVAFQQVLPKNFIHRMTGRTEMIYRFFECWKISYEAIGKSIKEKLGAGVRQQFIMTAKYLAEEYGYQIITKKKYLKRGYLVWLLNSGGDRVDHEQVIYPNQPQGRR